MNQATNYFLDPLMNNSRHTLWIKSRTAQAFTAV